MAHIRKKNRKVCNKKRRKNKFNPQDKYFHQAKEDGFKARSVYKLQEIQERYTLLKGGDTVLDLGAYPGSFAQYTRTIVGPDAVMFLVDLEKVPDVTEPTVSIEGDIYEQGTLDTVMSHELSPESFDVVMSDAMPKTTGVKDVDHYRSVELCERVLEIALDVLKPGGNLVMKIFQGSEYDEFLKRVKNHFEKVKPVKPDATRASSREMFLVCLGLGR